MSADFEKVLVKDDRLDVKDVVRYAVVKGGQNVTCAQYRAISESNSQITFNIQVPSEQTIIDRRVLLRTTITFVVKSYETIAAGATAVGVGYGALSSLAPFPMHQLMTVMSATINNNTVSLNVRDALPALLRLLDKHELTWANSTTPTFPDTLGSYLYNWQELSNPHAGYYNVNNTDVVPRGAFQLDAYTIATTAVPGGAAGITTETFTVTVTEPLLLSPFIFGHPKSNSQGFYGIQNMNFVLNIGDTSRFFRCPNAPSAAVGLSGFPTTTYTTTYPLPYDATANGSAANGFGGYVNQTLQAGTGISITNFSNTSLLFEFLTPHPSDMMPARNIVPFYELPRYISTFTTAIPAATVVQSGTSYSLTPRNSGQISAQSLQLNQIPDKLIIYARKRASAQNHGDPDVALGIGSVSINFNNNSGILASATRQDLWQMSKHAGNNETWFEWEGEASSNVWSAAANKLQPATNLTTGFAQLPTVGSYLVLEFGKDIQLVEDYYAPGSLGNFNLQVNLSVLNYNLYDVTEYEVVIITMNSGVFVNERGTSSTYTGILTKQDVLEASQQQAYTKSDVARLVGGGFLDMVKSGVQKLAPIVLPMAKDYLGKMDNTAAKAVSGALGAMGYGPSAGGPSAGGPSAGGPARGRHRVDARLA